jgi:hypothetical protein
MKGHPSGWRSPVAPPNKDLTLIAEASRLWKIRMNDAEHLSFCAARDATGTADRLPQPALLQVSKIEQSQPT